MAALCTGNYGLTQNCIDTSKEYYFVKLTDSALRAVEDYQKNQGKNNTQATIQIDGNSGVISFPSAGQQFRFSIDDIEGSFECLKQTQNQLEVQGALPFKLRIHANDDVYETTKHRMAVAEENQKNKCTREIKPNQTDIGRKVKLKSRHANIPPKRDPLTLSNSSSSLSLGNTLSQSSPLSSSTTSSSLSSGVSTTSLINPASLTHQQQQYSTGNSATTMSPLSTSSGTSGYSTSSISPLHSSSLKSSNSNMSNSSLNNSSSAKLHSSYHSTNNVTSASSLSSALSSAAGSGTSGISSSYYGNSNNSRGSSGMSMTAASLTSSSSSRRSVTGVVGMNQRNQRNGSRHMPDITKRKLRDRLIHLLALKPYKKPELYVRLQNEGIREREKQSISVILKEISTIRDNTYNLKRQIWNDVNEDWPFYTEQELQMLKRRKPQNLTPPISSDGGSSTSGQSPTSTHNGSPPPAVKRPSLDRDRYFDEPIAKKQRISHFRKDNSEINSSNLSKHHEPEDNAMSLSYGVLGSEAARRISSREDATNLNGHSNSSMNTSTSHHHSSIIPNSHHHINNNTNNNNNNTNSSNKNNSTNSIFRSSGTADSGGGGGGGGGGVYNSSPNYSSSNGNSGKNGNRLIDSRQKGGSSNNVSSSVLSPRMGTSSSSSGGNMMIGCSGSDMIDDSRGGILGNHGVDAVSPGAGTRNSAITDHHTNDNLTGSSQGSRNSSSISSSSSSSSSSSKVSRSASGNALNAPYTDGPIVSNSGKQYDFSGFTMINSVEQRRMYKAEFEKNYAEYRNLLQMIENVSKKFKTLAAQLEENRDNPRVYRDIRRTILSEYEKTNRDSHHQKCKARFNYLHAKLAHIKALVHEFDKTLTSSGGNGAPTQSPLQQNIGNDALANDNFGNINSSPGLSRRGGSGGGGGGVSGSGGRRQSISSPIMNGSLGNSPPGLHQHLSENY